MLGNIVADFVAAPVLKHPGWGELYQVERPITLNIGGNAAIFGAVASKLGLETALLGALGDDDLGRLLGAKLNAAGVDTSRVIISDKSTTSATLVLANDIGERSFFHHFGANRDLTGDVIDLEFIANAKALFLCSYFIMPGLERNTAKQILKQAKDNNLTTFFDLAWDPSGRWELIDEGILDYVDVFIPNNDELVKITKKTSVPAAVRDLLDAGIDTVAVKMGAKGCYVENKKGQAIQLKAHDVNAIDTTGAGDTFNAGFVYGKLAGWDLEKIARFANAAAAFSVTKLGGATGAPTVDEIDNFLENSK